MADDFHFSVEEVGSRPSTHKESHVIFVLIMIGIAATAVGTSVYLNRHAIFTGRTAVTSAALTSVGYDHNTSTLEIEFTSGEVYRYFDVPPTVASGLMSADSKGEYFNRAIKQAGYRFQHLTDQLPHPGQSPTTTAVDATKNNMLGNWVSADGDIYNIRPNDDALVLSVISSRHMAQGGGNLHHTNSGWTGNFGARFKSDVSKTWRAAPLTIVMTNENELYVSTSRIAWDDAGQEVTRRPMSFSLRRQ